MYRQREYGAPGLAWRVGTCSNVGGIGNPEHRLETGGTRGNRWRGARLWTAGHHTHKDRCPPVIVYDRGATAHMRQGSIAIPVTARQTRLPVLTPGPGRARAGLPRGDSIPSTRAVSRVGNRPGRLVRCPWRRVNRRQLAIGEAAGDATGEADGVAAPASTVNQRHDRVAPASGSTSMEFPFITVIIVGSIPFDPIALAEQ